MELCRRHCRERHCGSGRQLRVATRGHPGPRPGAALHGRSLPSSAPARASRGCSSVGCRPDFCRGWHHVWRADGWRANIEKTVGKLDKYLRDDSEVQVRLSQETVNRNTAELTILLPGSILRSLDEAEINEYRRPFLRPGEDRRPVLSWPREIPIAGEPEQMVKIVEDYARWLATCDTPKLFGNAEPGSILVGRQREFCRSWPNQREITVKGSHFIQEDSPDEIGAAVAGFVRALRGAGVALALPLTNQGELVALVNIGPRNSEQEFSSDDRELLRKLAAHAAPAVRILTPFMSSRELTFFFKNISVEAPMQVARTLTLYLLSITFSISGRIAA